MAASSWNAYTQWVNRDRLLEALANKGVPAWIIKFVASWLWKSHTYLHQPGRRPESLRINIGIPQGGTLTSFPLSTILISSFEVSPSKRTATYWPSCTNACRAGPAPTTSSSRHTNMGCCISNEETGRIAVDYCPVSKG